MWFEKEIPFGLGPANCLQFAQFPEALVEKAQEEGWRKRKPADDTQEPADKAQE